MTQNKDRDADTSVKTSTLDLRGLKCPLPALFSKRALSRAPRGSLVDILCDDPLCAIDIPHMCHTEGFEVVEQRREGDVTRLLLRRP